jgi:hypothetical protein
MDRSGAGQQWGQPPHSFILCIITYGVAISWSVLCSLMRNLLKFQEIMKFFGVMERRGNHRNFVHMPKFPHVGAQYNGWQWFCSGMEGRLSAIIFLTVI